MNRFGCGGADCARVGPPGTAALIGDNGTAAAIGDRLGQAACVAGVVMMVSYSMGVNRPRASCLRRRW